MTIHPLYLPASFLLMAMWYAIGRFQGYQRGYFKGVLDELTRQNDRRAALRKRCESCGLTHTPGICKAVQP